MLVHVTCVHALIRNRLGAWILKGKAEELKVLYLMDNQDEIPRCTVT